TATSETALAQLGEELRLFREKAAADTGKLRNELEAVAAERDRANAAKLEAVAAERDQATAAKTAHEAALARQSAEAVSGRGEVETALKEVRESFRAFRETALAETVVREKEAQEALGQERQRYAALEQNSEESRGRQEVALEEEREQIRLVKAKARDDADALQVAEESLARGRERVAVLEREGEARREQQAAELETEREGVRALRETASGGAEALLGLEEALAAERARCAVLEREGDALKGRLESDLDRRGEELRVSREEVEGGREALRVSEETLKTERERFEGLRVEAEGFRKEQEAVAVAARTAAEEILSKERGEVAALRESAAEQRQALAQSEQALAAERQESSALKREAGEFKEKSEADARDACAAAEAAAAKGRKESSDLREGATNARKALKRSEEALAAERKKFASWKRTTEAKMELLRREATRAGDLEDQLASKALRLKQKEAETRALASDGNMVRGLRESLSCKDNALNELRQELGSLRIASAAAAEAETAARLQQHHQQHQQQHRLSMGSQMQAPALPSPASRGVASVNGGGGGVAGEGGDLVRTLSASSGDSFGEAVGLGAIAEAEEVEEEEEEGEGQVGGLSSESESESEDEEEESGSEVSEESRSSSVSEGVGGGGSGDGSGGDAKGAATVATAVAVDDPATANKPRGRLTLSLDTNADTDSGESDDDEEEEMGEESFATLKFAAADEAHAAAGSRRPARTSGGARLSISSYSLSPGPRGVRGVRASVAPGSKSLSPVPRKGGVRASWSPGGGGLGIVPPMSNCLSPMVRLAPMDHGMGKEGNTVVLELGAWRVRVGVVGEGGSGEGGGGGAGGGQERASYFDDFPCCLASPLREEADLDELVNGASSLAAPMYSKFRESGVFVGGDAWYCCLDHPSIALRSKLKLSCPMQRGQKPTREETDRLVDHAYGLLKQDPEQAPTLLTYKPTATVDEVLGVASVLLESHRVPAIRMVNEAQLSALATETSTGVMVDIGEAGISVTPIYYGCPVASGVRSEACGGSDVTKYLDYMLLSRTNEQFNQM
ncbi:unnamed protein product, partial [Laminaria digitata]